MKTFKMFQYDLKADATVVRKSDVTIWKDKSSRVLEEDAADDEDKTEVETSVEVVHNEMQQEEAYMDCSLFRVCSRCTEIEFSRIMECQSGKGRITTFRCTSTTTDETAESDPSIGGGGSSTNTDSTSPDTTNNDRETRSYQEYRKDDAYYNNNDNLSMIDLSTTALLSPSTVTPTILYHYESCSYTKDEYEFNYIQFQVFICLLGIISIYSIRKQKMFAASLFDQRRMKNTTGNSNPVNTTTTSTSNVSRANSNSSSRGIVIQRSNTGLMNHNSQNTNNDGNNVNSSISIEMKSLLSSGSSINDMDIV